MEATETYMPSNSNSVSIQRFVGNFRSGFVRDPNQDQCKKIVSRIKEDKGLVWAAEEACENSDV